MFPERAETWPQWPTDLPPPTSLLRKLIGPREGPLGKPPRGAVIPRGRGLMLQALGVDGEQLADPGAWNADSPGLPWASHCLDQARYLIWHSQELCFQGAIAGFPFLAEVPGRSRQSPSQGEHKTWFCTTEEQAPARPPPRHPHTFLNFHLPLGAAAPEDPPGGSLCGRPRCHVHRIRMPRPCS